MRRKVLLVAIIIAMLLQCVMPFVTVNAASGVVITLNSNLYKAVKEQLKSQRIAAEYKDANGIIVISQSELEKVTSLDLRNSEIDDLTNLDKFSNVTSVNLHANKLTENSNLHALDALSLTFLDLSSNQISSIKTLTSYSSIARADITDQRITQRLIIKVDDSEDAESHEKKYTVTLPDILLEDGNQIKADWLVDRLGAPTRTIIPCDPDGTPASGDETYPEIDYASSFAPGSTDMVINVATGGAASYQALRGLIKFEIKVNDSTSKLADTHMIFYFAVVNSEECGIAFEDENMYKAVRNQLTAGQKDNEELESYYLSPDPASPAPKTLYDRTYDEALITVIPEDTIVNKIPSLILNDKKIKDLTGLEEFVGLESNLDISYNYISTIEKIVELEANKVAEETRIREKYSKILDELKTNITGYDTEDAKYKEADKKYNKAMDEYAALTDAAAKAAKLTEATGYLTERGDAETARGRYLTLVNKFVEKLYKIYEKEYKLVSLLPEEVNYLSYDGEDGLLEADLDTVKGYAVNVMDRISAIEKASALTDYENWAIRKLMTAWGTDNSIEFKTKKTVYTPNPADPAHPIETEEDIEFPISEFFDLVKADVTLDITDYEELVYIFKCIDALGQVENYTIIKRLFEGTSISYVDEALSDIRKLYEQKEYDLTFYNLIEKKTDIPAAAVSVTLAGGATTTEGYWINVPAGTGLYEIQIGLAKEQYEGAITGDAYKLKLAHRQALVTAEDISAYITLPRVQKLNMADNKTRSLEGIDTLSELKELNAWKNLVNDISNVDWEVFTKLKKLNLGFNQISDISPLQVLLTLEELDVSYNLLSGRFTFRLINMKDLTKADFSHNQYSDIQYVHDQYILKALGYDVDGDGVADGLTVPEYLEAAGIEVSFKYQTLDMSTTIVKTAEEFVEFELPLIFRQLEAMDHEKTSFGVDSLGGIVEPEGTTVKLRVPEAGTSGKAVVSVEGRSGYGYTVEGIGYGTTCAIHYSVVAEPAVGPTDPTDPAGPTDPTDPTGSGITFGYTVRDGFIQVNTPGVSKVEFARKLVDLDKYTVTISQNKSETKVGTGAIATVVSKTDPSVEAIVEIVVKGDINGDGDVDAIDSGIINNVIADRAAVVGSYKSAADVNNDGDVDSQDSMLILKYRADRISSF